MPDGSPIILVLVGSIMLAVLSVGLGTTAGAGLRLLQQPGPTASAMAAMFLVMPLLALLLAWLLPVLPAGRTALLALALSPLPPLFTRKSEALDEDYVIGTALAAAVVSVVVAPLYFVLIERVFGLHLTFDAGQMIGVLLLTVVGPLLAGIAINRWFPAVAGRVRKPLGQVALAVLLGGALFLVIATWNDIRAAASPVGLLAVALMIGLGLAVGHWLGGPEPARRRALAVATISRHPGVAIGLAAMAGTVPANAMLGTVLFYFVLSGVAGFAYLRVTDRR